MSTRIAALIPAAALLLAASAAHARTDPSAALAESARAFGFDADLPAPPAVSVSTPPAGGLTLEDGQVNFEYAEMVDRMEKLSRTVIGRNKKKRTINTGVTPADRVDRGEIKYIVVHASGGAGSCDGSVSHLLGHNTAAHFMVCRDGRVTRMVKIEDIANHVKNSTIEKSSVGIETESGYLKAPVFRPGDWAPAPYWRLYASLAWLIRAVAKEANVARDRDHIITHAQSDRGLRDAHVDPGPYFDVQTYADFDGRFPGQGVTPREFLMRLVLDDTAPQIWMVSSATGSDAVQIKDVESLGLAHIRVWSLDAAGKPAVKTYEWSAPVTGLPPDTLVVPVPREPGSYRVVARDLVGNTSAALVKVPGPGTLATFELALAAVAE